MVTRQEDIPTTSTEALLEDAINEVETLRHSLSKFDAVRLLWAQNVVTLLVEVYGRVSST